MAQARAATGRPAPVPEESQSDAEDSTSEEEEEEEAGVSGGAGAGAGAYPVAPSLSITPATVRLIQRFLRATGLMQLEPVTVFSAVLSACGPEGELTQDGLNEAIAALMSDADRTGAVSGLDMRIIVSLLHGMHETLAAGEGEAGVDVLDALLLLLPCAAGRKSEKLSWAWKVLDDGETGGLNR